MTTLTNIDKPGVHRIYFVALYETHAYVGCISGMNLSRTLTTIERGRVVSEGEALEGWTHGSREQMRETFGWITEAILDAAEKAAPRNQIRVGLS